MCKYCKYNELSRKKFKKFLWQEKNDVVCVLDVANIGTYINGNSLVAIYFDGGVGIEQDELKIACCPMCERKFN